jgi:hypothetical protein
MLYFHEEFRNIRAMEEGSRQEGCLEATKSVLCTQVHCMKNVRQCPTCNPSPLPIFYLENDFLPILYSNVLIMSCPFCLKGFEPSWDYKLASLQACLPFLVHI